MVLTVAVIFAVVAVLFTLKGINILMHEGEDQPGAKHH